LLDLGARLFLSLVEVDVLVRPGHLTAVVRCDRADHDDPRGARDESGRKDPCSSSHLPPTQQALDHFPSLTPWA
jgi:hypothetical protein